MALITSYPGISVQVIKGVAIQIFQILAAFEEKTDVELICHPNAAMQLDGFSGHTVTRFAKLGLGQARQFRISAWMRIQVVQCTNHQ